MDEPWWFVNVVNVLLFFVIMTALFHVIFVLTPWFRLESLGWKAADFVIIPLTSVSLISAVAAARQHQLSLIEHSMSRRVETQHRWVASRIDWPLGYFCGPWNLDPDYPNREHHLDQRRRACEWFGHAHQKFRDASSVPDAGVGPELFTDDPSITGDAEREYIDGFFREVKRLRELTLERNALRERLGEQIVDIALVVLSPVLLAFAFALRMAKVTGEVRIAREDKRKKEAQKAVASGLGAQIG